jgi:hypothetical protein
MDNEQFDDLTPTLANSISRRQTLKSLAGSAVANLWALVGGDHGGVSIQSAAASTGQHCISKVRGKTFSLALLLSVIMPAIIFSKPPSASATLTQNIVVERIFKSG